MDIVSNINKSSHFFSQELITLKKRICVEPKAIFSFNLQRKFLLANLSTSGPTITCVSILVARHENGKEKYRVIHYAIKFYVNLKENVQSELRKKETEEKQSVSACHRIQTIRKSSARVRVSACKNLKIY